MVFTGTQTCFLLEMPVPGIKNVRQLSGPIQAQRRQLEAKGLQVIHVHLSDWQDDGLDRKILLQEVCAFSSCI